ncbi:ion channel [Streptacidiphilus rugosus]|uniref:ion channel n=1 Tax=Streptacidiphilus rugosus TaxID=405783 RepID=UPI00068EEFE9|nr:ion channel [Streptacidiphilus rugosus]
MFDSSSNPLNDPEDQQAGGADRSTPVDQGPRFERWSRATAVPLLVLGCVFLAVILFPVLGVNLSRDQTIIVWVVGGVIWGIFLLDYWIKLWLAEYRKAFFWDHIFDLALLVLPMFRPLGALRAFGLFALIGRAVRRNRILRTASYTGGAFVMLLLVGSYTEWLAERHAPGANITTLGDSLWWALVTMATVGYGDYVPVTATGRMIASVLMVTGIATLSVVTASVASWLVQLSRREDDKEAAAEERRRQVEEFRTLLREVQQLNERLARLETRWDERQRGES